jgi:ATP-binding cassette subfamily G (WHITE) protein 2 (PDR)
VLGLLRVSKLSNNILRAVANREKSVLATPATFPRFWIFMYRISPFTYLVSGVMSTGLANADVVCADIEYLHFDAPPGETCGSYMTNYINAFGGYLQDNSATTDCSFCSLSSTNQFLAGVNSFYDQRWRNFGLLWIYIAFNVAAAIGMYWLVRVPKKPKAAKKDKEE